MLKVAKSCSVIGCNKPVVANSLCDMHRKRVERHGYVEPAHPDRGQREKHPLYKVWCGLMRYHKRLCDPRWHDLWAFAEDIGPVPSERARFNRIDRAKPWAAGNVFWKEITASPSKRDQNSAYMRAYQCRLRAANPDYFRGADLKRNYGVTLTWYNEQLEKQGHACAICLRPETMQIRGRTVRLAVDHCHDTGKVRGLLCAPCNQAVGGFGHSIDRLHSAIAYLRQFE